MSVDHLEDRALALQLHAVLSDIDPARWRDEMGALLKPRLHELQRRLESRQHHVALADTLKAEIHGLESKSQWLAFKRRVQPLYIDLAKRLSDASIHVPSIRPTNYARNVFHITTAMIAVLLIEFVASPAIVLGVALAWATAAWTAEILRRSSVRVNAFMMKLFSQVAHPHEAQRVNSATWYATALVLLALTGSTLLCVVGVAVLGVGDPVAALVGRRFGRIKLMHGRSLEGTLGFMVSATAATWAALTLFHPTLGLGVALAISATASVAGALAELVSLRIDDNFSIPLSAAAGAVLVTALAHTGL